MKYYERLHESQEIANQHIAKIKARGGDVKQIKKGEKILLEYTFGEGYSYTVWLVDYSSRKKGDYSKTSYQDFPRIFEGDEDSWKNFMTKKYPKAIKISYPKTKDGKEQAERYWKLKDSDNFPITPHLVLHIGNVRGMSGWLEEYLLKPIKKQ